MFAPSFSVNIYKQFSLIKMLWNFREIGLIGPEHGAIRALIISTEMIAPLYMKRLKMYARMIMKRSLPSFSFHWCLQSSKKF